MRIAVVLVSALLVGLAAHVPVYGDIVVFKVPTTKLTFILQGKALSSTKQPTVNFTHSSKQTFDLPNNAETKIITMATPSQIGTKRIAKAKGSESDLKDAASFCLDHGLLTEFHRAIDQLAMVNSADPFAVEAKRLKEELAKPLGDTAAAEDELMKEFGGSGGKVYKTAHFLLVHNGEKADKSEVKRKNPQQRADQLEQMLEMFVMKCAEKGLPVHVPSAPLKVAVVNPIPKKVGLGNRPVPLDKNIVWSADRNLLMIDEKAKIAPLEAVKKLQTEVQKQAAQPKSKRNQPAGSGAAPAAGMAGGGGNGLEALAQMSPGLLTKLGVTLQALLSIGVENHELESTSREAAYMFLANCGVVTQATPRWIQDGLAAYFEFPTEMGWTKIGDVGQVRNAWYQASLQDPDKITVTDIVTDHCYEDTQSPNAGMRAGTQAWALVHYLIEVKPEGLATYLRNFQSMPPDVVLGEDVLLPVFDQAFDGDRQALEDAWRTHMSEVKADYLVLEETEAGTPVEN